jgi:hypothetical protein
MISTDYALEIMEICEEGGEPLGWFSKGHWDPEEFIEFLRKFLLESYECDDDLESVEAENIEQTFWRNVPCRKKNSELNCLFRPGKPGSRGSYPVTVFRI